MVLSLLFFFINLNLLSNSNNIAFVRIKVENERNEIVKKARIIYRYGRDEINIFTNDKGEAEFTLNAGIGLLKIYKEGFYSKGHIENFLIGENNILVKISPKVGEIKGIISSNNNILANVPILLINDKNEVIETTKSSDQGSFNFYKVPLFRKYYLKVIKENFLPHKSDEIVLKERKKYTRNIHLKTKEMVLIIEVCNKENKPLNKVFVEIDGREHETDGNGITMFKISPTQKDDIIVKIREYKIEKKVQIIKGKKYLTQKMVID